MPTLLANEALVAWLQATEVADLHKMEALLIVVVHKRVCLRARTSMRPEFLQEGLEAASHATNCAVAFLVQEHPVAVLRRRGLMALLEVHHWRTSIPDLR